MNGIEVLDMNAVSCDGKRALADFEVWDPKSSSVKTVRVEYVHDQGITKLDGPEELSSFVAQCPQCLADVREVVMYERDINRSMN